MIKISKVLYDSNDSKLTPRAIEVLVLLRDGNTNEEIGEILHISESTVKTYMENLRETFGVRNRTTLAAIISKYFPKDYENDAKYRHLLNLK